MPYLSVEEFRDETIMPAAQVDEINMVAPNWLGRQLVKKSAWIDAQLRKRYAAPFASPYPEAVKDWLARIVTHLCYLRLGTNPTDEQASEIKADRTSAEAEIAQAADSEKGLFDLPLRQDTTASGISKQGPKSYTEASPYAGMTVQRNRARGDDQRGRGSGG
jgi:hypothetical protein